MRPLALILALSSCTAYHAAQHPGTEPSAQDCVADMTMFVSGVALQFDATHDPHAYNRTEDLAGIALALGVFVADVIALRWLPN